jgi:hypothetical protein
MRELPTGTLTMLFSDIEGSTVLLSRLGTRDLLSAGLGYVASAGNSDILATTLELAACTLAELGEQPQAARLAGAAAAVRQAAGMHAARGARRGPA